MRPPRSARATAAGVEQWEGPFEGIPEWLLYSVGEWVERCINFPRFGLVSPNEPTRPGALKLLELGLHVQLDWRSTDLALYSAKQLLLHGESGIDLLDWCAGYLATAEQRSELEEILSQGTLPGPLASMQTAAPSFSVGWIRPLPRPSRPRPLRAPGQPHISRRPGAITMGLIPTVRRPTERR